MGSRRTLRRVAAAFAVLIAPAVLAQVPQVTGSFSGVVPSDGFLQLGFTCSGVSPCTGSYRATLREESCSNTFTLVEGFSASGFATGAAGPIQGSITPAGLDFEDVKNPNGTCSIRPGSSSDVPMPFTGTWNGTTGSFEMNLLDNKGRPIRFTGTYAVDNTPPSQAFSLAASGTVDDKSGNVRAEIRFRPEDIGRTASVYAFAVAPATIVQGASVPRPLWDATASGEGPKADPVACVLAQLNASGSLAAATPSTLQAYVTGILSAQGQSVAVLNGVPPANVAGATFYVGYGASGTAMIDGGLNRSVVSVPGAVKCEPQPPQTGWWWNPLEDGRGFSIEVRGNHLFFASFLYDPSGRSTWYVSSGPVSLDGTLYTGDLLSARGGQTLGGPYPGFPAVAKEGTLTLAFNDASHGTMVWPGGAVPIQRFNIVPDGLAIPVKAGLPESGWWWNEAESGRGFFMEWQNGVLDLAGYMYDDAGNPVWYITVGGMAGNGTSQFGGNWWSYGNGQTLTGPWKPNAQLSNSVAPVTVTFSARDTAVITLPNGRTSSLRRHRF